MKAWASCLASMLVLSGCLTYSADHFYALSPQPERNDLSRPDLLRTAFTRQVSLRLTLPSLVDRGELVLSSDHKIVILEHERWASPLVDQFSTTLGQDLETRRASLVITNRSLEQTTLPLSRISVEVVRINAERDSHVTIETRWRIVDSSTGNTSLGRDEFSAQMSASDYGQLARALSQCIAQLADRLLAELPAA